MHQHRVGLVWFENDLRIDDHPLLCRAAAECQQLILLYCVNPKWFKPNRYGLLSMGQARQQFLEQSLHQLDTQLATYGQRLVVSYQPPLETIARLIAQYGIDAIYRSANSGFYERQYLSIVRQRYPFLQYVEMETQTLFNAQQLEHVLTPFPASFSKFRQLAEPITMLDSCERPLQLPPAPTQFPPSYCRYPQPVSEPQLSQFEGGCSAGIAHVKRYFESAQAQHYKQTRNALDEWTHSTKFSPWLALGCVSPRQIISLLDQHEQAFGANDSTYWIYFELLWREYFQHYARHYGALLFNAAGIRDQRQTTSFYATRFKKWCQGNTPYPIVNACMKQLNSTGYMSNRGRQLVASCFVHELQLDWRYGAAYFEQQLIDYDVAANWGNWQYLAGVGADPRGHRWFDLAKQTSIYDPQHSFIKKWQGDVFDGRLDHVDMVDWPIAKKP